MALPTTQQSREYQNFKDVGDGTTSRQVEITGASASGLATETTLSAINTKVDVNLSTRASESTLSSALTQLQEINAGTPAALGQTTMANSQPVVLASDHSDVNINVRPNAGFTDAFSRWRVSTPESIFDCNFRFGDHPLIWSSSTATGGTVTNNSNRASMELAVTASSGSSAIYQSKRYFPYNAGKSQLVLMTGNLGAPVAGNRKRIGLFDDSDGLYFEVGPTSVSVVIRSSVSGAPVDSSIAQASWNIDKLDGTGASGITLNTANQLIFLIDYQWLGSGRVRFGFVINGRIIYCHEFNHSNLVTTPYMRSGMLPLRAENTNTGASTASTLFLTCVNVQSEGNQESFGLIRSLSRDFTPRTVTTAQTPLVSFRLRSTTLQATAELLFSSVFGTTADDLLFQVHLNPTLTGATFAAFTGTVTEGDTAATAMTAGSVIYQAYIRATAGGTNFFQTSFVDGYLNRWLGSNLAGTSDIFTLSARCATGTAAVYAAVHWKEYF